MVRQPNEPHGPPGDSDLVVAEDVARLVLVQAGTVITEIGRAV